MRPQVPRNISQDEDPKSKSKSVKVKFVDDGTVAVSVNLKSSLAHDPVVRPRPFNYHERTGHVLPVNQNLLQDYIREAEQFTTNNKMVINKQKTKVMSFTKSKKWDFSPELEFSDGTGIECVSRIKLVGVIVTQDLKWSQNTEYICGKARTKLWILRRMKNMELDFFQLYDIYTKEVRSILEMAVPVWHPSLTKQQSADIERIQKLAFKIILQDRYQNYELACEFFATETLENRRTKLCYRFAVKNFKSDHSFFTKVVANAKTRHAGNRVYEYKCNFGRFRKSSIPYLARLLNSQNK